MNNVLAHSGVKGMKWYVRRFQNKDGSLTDAGKMRYGLRNRIIKNRSTNEDVNEIVSTLSVKEKKLLGASTNPKDKWISPKFSIEQTQHIAKRILIKQGNKPVSMIEAWDSDYNKGPLEIAIATRSGKEYRGKGHATKLTSDMLKWFDRYGSKHYSEIQWWANIQNSGSNALAKSQGFKYIKTENNANVYSYKKHSQKLHSL